MGIGVVARAKNWIGAIMDSQDADARRVLKLKVLGITIGIVIVIPILAWKWGLL